MKSRYKDTNAEFAARDSLFRTACSLAGVEPTQRQASKWRNGRGRAYAKRHEATVKLQQEAKPNV